MEQPSQHDQRLELNDDESLEMEFEGGSMKGGRSSEQKMSRKKTSKMS